MANVSVLERLRDIEAQVLQLECREIAPVDEAQFRLYEARLEQLEASHSHSWFGDHSSTYYEDFRAPPAGKSFDVEWGFVPRFDVSSNRGWRVYSRTEIREFVFDGIGEDIFNRCHGAAEELTREFVSLRDQALDLLGFVSNASISRYVTRIDETIKPFSIADYINGKAKECPRMTRDSEEIAKGSVVPAHVQYVAAIQSFDVSKRKLKELSGILRNSIELISMLNSESVTQVKENRIFIGHGRSEQWRVLKDFVRDTLQFDYEEFNRVSAAGINTQERLGDMLNSCNFAFLILTAEDVHSDDTIHARENVVHECGLFQGRLGWRRAIVLLEEGCNEFSNVVGLGQIRFPRGNIGACFEQIRQVLHRESLIAK